MSTWRASRKARRATASSGRGGTPPAAGGRPVTDDLTTDLSRIENAFVISRNTAFTYKDKPVDAKQIGRELGVCYLLEGSVRRSGDQIRVNAQLIDDLGRAVRSNCGRSVCSPDDITSRIAVALDLELVSAKARRPTEHPDARDYIFRG